MEEGRRREGVKGEKGAGVGLEVVEEWYMECKK